AVRAADHEAGTALQTKLRLRRVLVPTRRTRHQSSSRGRWIRSEPCPGPAYSENRKRCIYDGDRCRERTAASRASSLRSSPPATLDPRRPPVNCGNYRRNAKLSGRRGDADADFGWRSTHSQRRVPALRRAIGSSAGEEERPRRLSAAARFDHYPPEFQL